MMRYFTYIASRAFCSFFHLRHFPAARFRSDLFCGLMLLIVSCTLSLKTASQTNYDGKDVSDITIEIEGMTKDNSFSEQFRIIARDALNGKYTTVGIRDAIADLYAHQQVASVVAEASDTGSNKVNVKFVIRRKTIAKTVAINVTNDLESKVTEQELLLRVSLLDPGVAINERSLQTNADQIVAYLREKGFFRATAQAETRPMASGSDVAVIFNVTPGQQVKVDTFNIDIRGANADSLKKVVKLRSGTKFSRDALTIDLESIRKSLAQDTFLAPLINEPRLVFDSESNTISVNLTGESGPRVEVKVEAEREKIGRSTQERLLPVVRDGTMDYSAIIEGERRLENHYQEKGYFFADVTSVCSIDPPLPDAVQTSGDSASVFLCSSLTGSDLTDRNVSITYRVDLNRRLKLVDIRLEGTDQFASEDIKGVLNSQTANILGVIPIFGYGRGYTSQTRLDEDAATIRSLLRELGYRQADVYVNQGVSLNGEDLIITFVVDEGTLTTVSEVEIRGNTAFDDAELIRQLPVLSGRNFSRARIRNGQRKLAEFYSNNGYYDAKIEFAVDDFQTDPVTKERTVKVIFNVENENQPVYVNRILVNGNVATKTSAITRALAIEPGETLKAADIYTSQQNLYSSDAFERVEIKPQPFGDRPDGGRLTDIIIDVQEQKPRLLQYGGGFSTDVGWSGFVDIRHFNLLGNLWQGGSRIRWSQRQQLAQIDFVNPRFLRDGANGKFTPLTLSAQYQRDSTVTRFFRSAFDRGTFGIVQRLDENGVPIDVFGNETNDPTLHRLSLSAETNRTLSRKDRSIVFFKYRFEDVRLYNTRSLLVGDLLEPDSRVRISGFSTTFVRDTRRNCNITYSILEIIARGDPGEKCRYNSGDPTNGSYVTAEYNISLPTLGANIGFHKFQAQYNFFYSFPRLKHTTIATRGILGLASVFSNANRFPAEYADLNGLLPISERFFAGGSNTLRGFEFESAGPRVVIVPQGNFHNRDGEPIHLDPFTIPYGGNALAIVNVEARVPLSKSIRAVPFYDGGNVFKRIRDIYTRPDIPANNVSLQNLRPIWSHTVGLGLRLKTPIGGEIGVDYGYLLNPPTFLIPQGVNPPANYRLRQSQIHFRFSQAF